MKITQIKQQKDLNRVNVYLDGEFSFGIDLENFVKLGLRVEQQLNEAEVEEIVRKAEFQKTFDKLLRFAMVRPRSEKEVRDWFRRKKVAETLYEELTKKLKKFELLDDLKFAKWWVQQRLEFKPKPAKVLKLELMKKGIDKNSIEDALAEHVIDEASLAAKELSRNKYKWERFEGAIAKKKMMEFLARKGYGWDVIKGVIKSEIDDYDSG